MTGSIDPMAIALFLIFIVMPFLELVVILQVASVIGGWPTLLLLVVESIVGAWLCKREGAGVLRRINQQLQDGQLPTTELVNGALILFAGVLMVTPGFITDILGFILLIPPTRALVRGVVLKRMQKRLENAMNGGPDAAFRVIRVTNMGTHGSPFGDGNPFGGGAVMDVDSRDVTARSGRTDRQLGDGGSAA